MPDDPNDLSQDPEPFDLSAMLPQAPPAAAPARPPIQRPAHGKAKGGLTKEIALAALMPLAAKRGGPAAVAALLNGIQRAEAGQAQTSTQQAQQDFENQRQLAGDERAVEQQQALADYRQQAIEQQRRAQASAIVKDFAAKLSAAETKEQVDGLSQAFRYAGSVVGLRPEAVEGLIAKAAPTPAATVERQVRKVVGGLTPEQVDSYLQGNLALTIPGQKLPVPVEVWSKYVVAGMDPVTGKRTVAVRKPDVPNTPEEQFYQQYAVERGAKSFGALPTATQAQARKTWMQADDRERVVGNGPRDRYNIQPIINPDGTTGLVRLNMDTGQVSPVTLPGGAGSGRGTDTERLSKAYLDRTTASDQTATTFEQRLARLGPQLDVQLPNLLKSDIGQQYKQAEDEFINAALRRESGAAIQPSEYDRFERIYFVRPGDTPATIRQKQAARTRVIDGFRVAAANMGQATPAAAPAPSGGGLSYQDYVNSRKAR